MLNNIYSMRKLRNSIPLAFSILITALSIVLPKVTESVSCSDRIWTQICPSSKSMLVLLVFKQQGMLSSQGFCICHFSTWNAFQADDMIFFSLHPSAVYSNGRISRPSWLRWSDWTRFFSKWEERMRLFGSFLIRSPWVNYWD